MPQIRSSATNIDDFLSDVIDQDPALYKFYTEIISLYDSNSLRNNTVQKLIYNYNIAAGTSKDNPYMLQDSVIDFFKNKFIKNDKIITILNKFSRLSLNSIKSGLGRRVTGVGLLGKLRDVREHNKAVDLNTQILTETGKGGTVDEKITAKTLAKDYLDDFLTSKFPSIFKRSDVYRENRTTTIPPRVATNQSYTDDTQFDYDKEKNKYEDKRDRIGIRYQRNLPTDMTITDADISNTVLAKDKNDSTIKSESDVKPIESSKAVIRSIVNDAKLMKTPADLTSEKMIDVLVKSTDDQNNYLLLLNKRIKELLDGFKSGAFGSSGEGILDDIGDFLDGPGGRGKRRRAKRGTLRRKMKARGLRAKRGVGRLFGKIGRGIGGIGRGLTKLPVLGTVAAGAGSLLSAGGSTVLKGGRALGSLAKGAGRVLGKAFLPVTAALAAYDGFKGWGRASENFDKAPGQEATTGEKVSSAAGGILSGLTFGLLDEKKTAKGIHKVGSFITDGISSFKDKVVGLVTAPFSNVKSSDKIFDLPKDKKATLSQNISSGIGNMISTVTFGLIKPEQIAKPADKILTFLKDHNPITMLDEGLKDIVKDLPDMNDNDGSFIGQVKGILGSFAKSVSELFSGVTEAAGNVASGAAQATNNVINNAQVADNMNQAATYVRQATGTPEPSNQPTTLATSQPKSSSTPAGYTPTNNQVNVASPSIEAQTRTLTVGDTSGSNGARIGNFEKAALIASGRASWTSQGECAKAVRMSLESAGYRLPSGLSHRSAYMYGSRENGGNGLLNSMGFDEIDPAAHKNPMMGDVVVFGPTAKHPHGHIAMYDGKQWVSDFKQHDINPYRDRKSAGKMSYYRDASLAAKLKAGNPEAMAEMEGLSNTNLADTKSTPQASGSSVTQGQQAPMLSQSSSVNQSSNPSIDLKPSFDTPQSTVTSSTTELDSSMKDTSNVAIADVKYNTQAPAAAPQQNTIVANTGNQGQQQSGLPAIDDFTLLAANSILMTKQ